MNSRKATPNRAWSRTFLSWSFWLWTSPILGGLASEPASSDAFLSQDGRRLFPIGFYEHPAQQADLQAIPDSGVNLVRCHNKVQLDKAQAVGLLGWLSLPVHEGLNDRLRSTVASVGDHPALAVWEGPDEVVWNFTAWSGLKDKAGFTREDWQRQRGPAVAYAEQAAQQIMPRMREAFRWVRENDPRRRPFWINEAAESDVVYVRRYLDEIDVTGCDFYPVKPSRRNLWAIGELTDVWSRIGRGKPVWMVLQGFSWHRVRPQSNPEPRYPTFHESRFMAYDALAHGARGLLYWGSETIDEPRFRESLYALTAELAQLQPFLVAREESDVRVNVIEIQWEGAPLRGVRSLIRRQGNEWLIALVNEDDRWHQAVEVTGLSGLEGRTLCRLYGPETTRIEHGELLTRLQAYEVKVFATSRRWESPRQSGRMFGD